MLIDLLLLRFAAEVEIGEDAPLLQRLNELNDGVGNPACSAQKLVPLAGGIRQDDHEEHCRFAAPIVSEGEGEIDYIGS